MGFAKRQQAAGPVSGPGGAIPGWSPSSAASRTTPSPPPPRLRCWSPPGEAEALRSAAEGWAAKVKAECPQDPGLTLTVTVREGEAKALSAADSRKLTDLIAAVPNGVQAMNPDLPGQVQTSLNLGILRLEDGKAQLVFLVRSSVAAEQAGLTEKLQSIATEFGAAFAVDSSYPPWEYRRESKLRDTMVSVFTELYGKAPVVEDRSRRAGVRPADGQDPGPGRG